MCIRDRYYSRSAFVICFFMVLLAATYFNTRRKIKNFKVVAVICTILVVGELFYNTNIYISNFSIKNTKEYNSYVSNARSQINEIKNYDNSTFYRVEQTCSRVTLSLIHIYCGCRFSFRCSNA